MKIETLDWDSQFFDKRIARVNIDNSTEKLDFTEEIESLRQYYDLLYIFSPKDYILKESENLILVDRKIIFETVIEEATHSAEVLPLNYSIRPYAEKTLSEDLLSLALLSGKYSRFNNHVDPHFTELEYKNLYTEWIRNSVNGTIADIVFCCYFNSKICGMLTLKIDRDENKGVIGLISVDKKFQGKRIASQMIFEVKKYLLSIRIKHLEVTTQKNNIVACNLYKKNSFKEQSVTYIYHYWL